MRNLYRTGTFLVGTVLMAFCGSALGHRLGLDGHDQWPIIGFALGLLLLSQVGVWTLRERVQALEDKVGESRGEEARTSSG